MSEYLTFNKSGQWDLHKSMKPPESDYKPGSKQAKVVGGNAKDGLLHEDTGRRGMLNNFGGGKRPKNQTNWQRAGKPFHDMESVHNERNPGVGD